MRVIDHPHAFMLLGADVLCGGRDSASWNFAGIKVRTVGPGKVVGSLSFEVGGEEKRAPLYHAPAGLARDRTELALVAGAPLKGA